MQLVKVNGLKYWLTSIWVNGSFLATLQTLQKTPELAEFYKELSHLEPASKVQLKMLLDERQSVLKGLEKVEAELAAAENDGPTSAGFAKVGVLDSHRGQTMANGADSCKNCKEGRPPRGPCNGLIVSGMRERYLLGSARKAKKEVVLQQSEK
jgi:uncharacterized protein YihD (DUF1040 family)